MEGVTAFVGALVLVGLLEIGDKTQLVTISLATRHPARLVLTGAVAGLVATTAIGAAIGGILAASLTAWLTYVKLGGGLLFIVLGVWTIVQGIRSHGKEEAPPPEEERRNAFVESFSFNFLAEFGDKTQIAVIILAATEDAPWSVFGGASLALAIVAVSSVVIGAGLAKVLSETWLRLISTGLFIAAGVLLILEAFAFL